MLVFDIARRESFEHLEMWIKEVEQYCTGGLERIRMILIGNKLDLKNDRQVYKDFCMKGPNREVGTFV